MNSLSLLRIDNTTTTTTKGAKNLRKRNTTIDGVDEWIFMIFRYYRRRLQGTHEVYTHIYTCTCTCTYTNTHKENKIKNHQRS